MAARAVEWDTTVTDRAWCRVLVVEHGGGMSGAERYLLRLAPLMYERGVEQILASPGGTRLARAWTELGRRHVPHDVFRSLLIRPADGNSLLRVAGEVARNTTAAWRTAHLARRENVHAIQANCHGMAHAEVVLAARLLGRPSVLHLHEETPSGLHGRVRALAVRGADAAVGVSAAVQRSLPDSAAAAVTVIQAGVDHDVFAPGPGSAPIRAELADSVGAPVVLVVSRLVPRKGIEDVIRAVAADEPALADARLAFAGAFFDPTYERTVRELAAMLLGGRVRFLGRREDVPDLLRAADVVVLASASEGLGLAVLEAQACGRAVVAYPAGGVGELITHGRTGLLASQGDVADLARQIATAVADPELCARLGADSRARVLAHNTLDRQADAHVALLRQLRRLRTEHPAVTQIPR